MDDDVRTIRILIEGRVQGVGFRAFVVREAAHRAIDGFVRNLRDGRVEVLARGDPDAIAALSEACGRGPLGSQVRRVDVTSSDEAPGHSFVVARDA